MPVQKYCLLHRTIPLDAMLSPISNSVAFAQYSKVVKKTNSHLRTFYL